MDLLRHLRSQRAERRRKQTFQPSLFDRINALVKAHALDESFLRRLEASESAPTEDDLVSDHLMRKEPFEPPLFSLSTEEQYRLTAAIIARLDNLYLGFVTSPDEILLCERLFRLNPSLPPDSLARHHFKALLLAETARKHIPQLTEEIQTMLDKGNLDEGDRSRLAALHQQIAGARRFVAGAEDAGAN